jgi:Fis family transcriptional regulator
MDFSMSSSPFIISSTLEQNILEKKPRTLTLRENVEIAINDYFLQLSGEPPVNLYRLVLTEVEIPLIESVMKLTQGNQTQASKILGMTRTTLRKKLNYYQLI